MPIEDTVKADFVLPLKVIIDYGVLQDILAIRDEEIAKKKGECRNKEQYVLRYDLIHEDVNRKETDVGWNMDGEHYSFYVHEQLMEINKFVQIECPVIQLNYQHEKTVDSKAHRIHEFGENGERWHHDKGNNFEGNWARSPHKQILVLSLERALELHRFIEQAGTKTKNV